MKNYFRFTFSMIAVLGICIAASAQSNVPPSLSLKLPSTAKHGATADGTLVVSFGPGLHAYQNPASDPDLIPIAVSLNTKGAKLRPVKYPAGTNMPVGGDPKPVKVYSGTIRIPISVVLPAKKGAAKLVFTFHYQQCNSNSCYPPADEQASATVTVR